MNPALEERREVVSRTGARARVEPGPWADRFLSPPPDVAISITPESGRWSAALAIGDHIREQLNAGRSLYCIVHDRAVQSRLGGFDGRALPAHCLRDAE